MQDQVHVQNSYLGAYRKRLRYRV